MLLAVALLVTGIVAVILEFFIPAFGIIGIIGTGSIIAGVVTAFRDHGSVVGSLFLIAAVVLLPLLIAVFFKFFPRSFMGKRLILRKEQNREEGYTTCPADEYDRLKDKTGRAFTDLRPSGTVLIDDRKYSVVTAGEYIEKDSPVEVYRVEGNRIIVRKGG